MLAGKEPHHQRKGCKQDEVVGKEPPFPVVGDIEARDVPEEGLKRCRHTRVAQDEGDGDDNGEHLEVGCVESLYFGEREA